MINWSKYFDRIYCINFSQFRKRKELMEIQLKRVGILDSGIFEWQITYNGPFEKLFCQMVRSYKYNLDILSPTRISCILGHINVIKNSYHNNYERILIIEDDERFLKDLDELEKKLNNLPSKEDYDLILLDKFMMTYNNNRDLYSNPNNLINEDYVKFNNGFSAGCYSINRNAMQLILSLYDSNNFNITDLFFTGDVLNKFWRKACATKNLAVQVVFNNIATLQKDREVSKEEQKSNVITFQMLYKHQEISFDDYMMRADGSPYHYGDYIEV